MNKLFEERERINRLYDAPEHRRIKYSAIAVISIVIILLLSLTIWIDKIPPKTIMIMRGCAGLGAIIFVILVGVLTYRVYRQHLDNRIRH